MNYGVDVVGMSIEEIGLEIGAPDAWGWTDACCPLHEETRPSFTINAMHGGWICRSQCGSGDLAQLISNLTGEKVEDARRRLIRKIPMDRTLTQRLMMRRQEGSIIDVAGEPLFYERSRVPKYMLERGFDLETLKKWEVGYDPESDAAVIPVRESGKLIGLIRRLVTPRGGPKYLYTRGMEKDKILFGDWMIPEKQKEVIVVEGPLDAMWLDQHGYHGVAILGSFPSPYQIDMLSRRFWEITMAFDPDRAGRKATELTADALKRLRLKTTSLPNGKDVQECTQEELKVVFTETQSLWYSLLRSGSQTIRSAR